MATEVVPFAPFLTQQHGLDAKIVDRNLLAIKQALDAANATIVRQQTIINRFVAGDTITIGPPGPPGPPAMDDGAGEDTQDVVMIGPPGENLIFSTGLTKAGHVVTANLSTGIAGGQTAIGGTGAAENLTLSSTSSGTKGKVIFGSTTGLYFDEAAQMLVMGTATPLVGGTVQVDKSQNAGTVFYFSNPNTGGNAYVGYGVMDRTDGSGVVGGNFLWGSGSTRGSPYTPGNWDFELSGGSGNMIFWVLQNSGDFVWHTTTTFPNPPDRMRLTNGGMLRVDGGSLINLGTTFSVGTSLSNADWIANVSRSRNGGAYFHVSNTNAGTAATSGYIITQSDAGYGANQFYFLLQSTGYTTVGPYTANSAAVEHVTATASAHMFFAATGPQDIDFYTTGGYARRLSITNAGEVQIPAGATQAWYNTDGTNFERVRAFWSAAVWNLKSEKGGAGSILPMKIDADTNTLTLYGASIFLGSGSTTDVTLTAATHELSINPGAVQAWYNAGGNDFVKASWSSNIWTLKSLTSGGTVRSMTVDANTATLTLQGNSVDVNGTTGVGIGYLAGVASTPQVLMAGTTSVLITAGTAGNPHPSANFSASQLLIDASIALTAGFPGASVWEGLKITGSATVPGTGTITAAFGATTFAAPSITGTGVGATVDQAATVLIVAGPTASSIGINTKYALWVQADATRLDGDLVLPALANGSVATVLGSLGPTGSHTTVQKWFAWKDTSGTVYYVPGF